MIITRPQVSPQYLHSWNRIGNRPIDTSERTQIYERFNSSELKRVNREKYQENLKISYVLCTTLQWVQYSRFISFDSNITRLLNRFDEHLLCIQPSIGSTCIVTNNCVHHHKIINSSLHLISTGCCCGIRPAILTLEFESKKLLSVAASEKIWIYRKGEIVKLELSNGTKGNSVLCAHSIGSKTETFIRMFLFCVPNVRYEEVCHSRQSNRLRNTIVPNWRDVNHN